MHFPMKLYELVETGPSDTVAWSSSGKSFLIVNPDAFCNHILPKHFRHNKLTSFQRQLNLYGFQRIAKGAEAGRYRHDLFERGRPDLTAAIKREPRASNNGGMNGGVNGGASLKAPSPRNRNSRSPTREHAGMLINRTSSGRQTTINNDSAYDYYGSLNHYTHQQHEAALHPNDDRMEGSECNNAGDSPNYINDKNIQYTMDCKMSQGDNNASIGGEGDSSAASVPESSATEETTKAAIAMLSFAMPSTPAAETSTGENDELSISGGVDSKVEEKKEDSVAENCDEGLEEPMQSHMDTDGLKDSNEKATSEDESDVESSDDKSRTPCQNDSIKSLKKRVQQAELRTSVVEREMSEIKDNFLAKFKQMESQIEILTKAIPSLAENSGQQLETVEVISNNREIKSQLSSFLAHSRQDAITTPNDNTSPYSPSGVASVSSSVSDEASVSEDSEESISRVSGVIVGFGEDDLPPMKRAKIGDHQEGQLQGNKESTTAF